MGIWNYDLETGKKSLSKTSKWCIGISILVAVGVVVVVFNVQQDEETDPNKMTSGRLSKHMLELAEKLNQNFTKDAMLEYNAVVDIWNKRFKGQMGSSAVDKRIGEVNALYKAACKRFINDRDALLDKMNLIIQSESPDLAVLRQLKSTWDTQYQWSLDFDFSKDLDKIEDVLYSADKLLQTEPNSMSSASLIRHMVELAKQLKQNFTKDAFSEYQAVTVIWNERANKNDKASPSDNKRVDETNALYEEACKRFINDREALLDQMNDVIQSESPDLAELLELKSRWDDQYQWSVDIDFSPYESEDPDEILHSVDELLQTEPATSDE